MNRIVWLLTFVLDVILAQTNYVYYEHIDMFYKFYTQALPWYDAKLMCASDGATLAMPRDFHEIEVLKQLFQQYPPTAIMGTTLPQYVYIGFHDIFTEGEYIGINGIDLQYYYQVWLTGQPDNLNNEDCLSMQRSGELNDGPCDAAQAFICQKNGNTTKTLITNCKRNDSEYVIFPEARKEYKVHLYPRRWDDARVICQLECGHLAVINNYHEEQFLTTLYNLPENQVPYIANKLYAHLGYQDMFKEGDFVTVTDERLINLGYTNWLVNQPDNAGNEDCVGLARNGQINDLSCDQPNVFICERDTTDTYEYNSAVDLYYKFYKTPLNWFDAKLKCDEDQATLAMPKNKTEVDAITALFSKYSATALPGVSRSDLTLIGFHDLFIESEYISLKGKSLQYYYHKWEDNQPNNFFNQDCMAISRNGKLNEVSCLTPSTFICQKPGLRNVLPPVNYKCATSDMAYIYADGINKCYKLHMNPKNWMAARQTCFSEGGHLTVVRNKAEENFLLRMFADPNNRVPYTTYPNYVLLGFHDMYKEGTFVTVLDEELSKIGYSNWNTGEPNGGTGENCGAMLNSGVWNDYPCQVETVFICEQPANPFYLEYQKGGSSSFYEYLKYIFLYQ